MDVLEEIEMEMDFEVLSLLHVLQKYLQQMGINFSTKSANESGTSFEFKFVINKTLQNTINKNFLKFFIEIFLYKL